MGGGGSKGYQNTSQDVTTTSSNVPDWMKGYYDNSLKRASAASNEPYKAYSADAADRIAGFNPAQTAVFNEVGAMTAPGQFNEASNMYSNMGNMGAAAATRGFGGAGIAQGMGINQAAMGARGGFGTAGQLAEQGNIATTQGMSRAFGAADALGGRGLDITDQGARATFGAADALGQRGQGAVDQGTQAAFSAADALGERGRGAVDQGMSRAFGLSAPQTFGAEQAQQYTNPYQQQVTDVALRKAREESIRQGNLANLSAAGRGTAGGTRQAVMDSMRNRDTATQLSDIQMQGGMRGYENAQQQFERDQGRRMGAAQLGANIAGQGFGAMGTAGGQYGTITGQGYGAMGQAAGRYGALTGLGLNAVGQAGSQYGQLTGQGYNALGQAGSQYGQLTGQGYNAAGQANQLLGATGTQGLGTGAGGLSAVGTAEQNANLARLNAQNKVGSQQEDKETAKINARIEQFYEGRGYNKEQIAWMINQMKQANSGASSNTTGSTYGRSPSLGTQMTGVTAAGLGSLI